MAKEKTLEIDLPFDPKKYNVVISQGFNSPFSHKPFNDSLDLTHSVDFALEPGTPVIAVQDGIVSLVQIKDSCYRGYDPIEGRKHWATCLGILNSDIKTYALMQHLDSKSILVKLGQEVTRGQALATTGLTGWVGPIPHLHLTMIDRSQNQRNSIPFKFRNYSGSLFDSDIDEELNITWPGWQKSPLEIQIMHAREEARRVMIQNE